MPHLNQRNLQNHSKWQPRPSRPSSSPQVRGGKKKKRNQDPRREKVVITEEMKIRRGRRNDPGRGATVLLVGQIANRMANRNHPALRKVPQGLLWSPLRQNGSNTSMDQPAFPLSTGTRVLIRGRTMLI